VPAVKGFFFAAALGLAGCKCGTDEPAAIDAAPGSLAFGDDCSSNEQCASGVCFEFGDGSRLCSSTCTADDQCPDGSRGQHCNDQGYCRP